MPKHVWYKLGPKAKQTMQDHQIHTPSHEKAAGKVRKEIKPIVIDNDDDDDEPIIIDLDTKVGIETQT